MATASRPGGPRIATAYIYAAVLFVCLLGGGSSQGALAAPVRPTPPLPLLLPSTLPSTEPQREERSDADNTTVVTLPVPHKDNHSGRPLNTTTSIPTLPEVHLPATQLPEVHLPDVHLPAVSKLPTLPAVANTTTTHHSDEEAFQVGNVHVQAQVKTPTDATEEEKKAALVEALRGAVGMLLRSQNNQNSTTTTTTTTTEDQTAAAAAVADAVAAKEMMPQKRDDEVLQKEDQPKQLKAEEKGRKEDKAKTTEELVREIREYPPPAFPWLDHSDGDSNNDEVRKRREKEDLLKQQNAMEKLRGVWQNFHQINSRSRPGKQRSKRSNAPSPSPSPAPAPDFAKKVALLQGTLRQLSADTANSDSNSNSNSNSTDTDTIADSTPTSPTTATTEPNTTAAAATDAKTAILQLAAAANNVRNSKKKDEVVNAVKAVKAVAAAVTGDLELEFWKKVIGILDDIFG